MEKKKKREKICKWKSRDHGMKLRIIFKNSQIACLKNFEESLCHILFLQHSLLVRFFLMTIYYQLEINSILTELFTNVNN